jgi:carbon storage regulator
MLVLSRKSNQEIQIGGDVTITVLRVRGDEVRLGITAPRAVPVLRGEVLRRQDGQEIDHAG